MSTPITAPMTLSMMSVTSQARSIRAAASWMSSIRVEYAASAASPTGTVTHAHFQRAATSTSSAPAGTKTTAFSTR